MFCPRVHFKPPVLQRWEASDLSLLQRFKIRESLKSPWLPSPCTVTCFPTSKSTKKNPWWSRPEPGHSEYLVVRWYPDSAAKGHGVRLLFEATWWQPLSCPALLPVEAATLRRKKVVPRDNVLCSLGNGGRFFLGSAHRERMLI